MEVQCQKCKVRFRITPRSGEPLPKEIPCPMCGSEISLEIYSQRTEKKEETEVTEESSRVVPKQPEEAYEPTSSDPSEPTPENPTPHSEENERPIKERKESQKGGSSILTYLLIALFALIAIATSLYFVTGGHFFNDANSQENNRVTHRDHNKIVPSPQAIDNAKRLALRVAIEREERAENLSRRIAALRDESDEDLRKGIQLQLKRANFGEAIVLAREFYRRQPLSTETNQLLAEAYLGARRYKQARDLIAQYAGRAEVTDLPEELVSLWDLSFTSDPDLPPRPIWITQDHPDHVTKIKALGGGRSLSFKIYVNGEKRWAFKPAQEEWNDGWRVEIAAYTLCQILPCSFEIPYTTTMIISREKFNELYPQTPGKQMSYAEQFYRLQWKIPSQVILDRGFERRELLKPNETRVTQPSDNDLLYGAAKKWVPHFANWPIEYNQAWSPLLTQAGDETLLNQPISNTINTLQSFGYDVSKLKDEVSNLNTYTLAHQISDLMVFDFLINNWDRFSTQEEYYGVNNQFADGHFVSIDNGAGFHNQNSARVTRRLHGVERFSASMIAALKLLDKEKISYLLFPSHTADEQMRLKVFWDRRNELLNYVADLIRKYGRDRVLYF